MKMKRILAAFLSAALAASCCACAQKAETAAEVLEKMHAALAETPCGHAQMTMELTAALDGGALGTLDMRTATTYDIRVARSPVSGCTTATTDVDYGGEQSRTVTENYSVTEDGALVSYVHSDGVWLKLATDRSPEDFARSAASVSVDAASAAIDETVTEHEGRAAICLTTRLGGETLEATLGGLLEGIGQQGGALGEAAEAMDGIDYAALTCDARIYLDKETYLPLAEEMTFSGMSEVLSAAFAPMGVEAEVTACTASAAFLSYEMQEEIVLPEGAREKAEAWTRLLSGEPDNGDGTFTIREGSALIDIAAPEGFTVSDKDYDHVTFTRGDHRTLRYTAVYGDAEYLSSQVDGRLARYGDLPKSVSRTQLTLTGDVLAFEADIVGVEWSSYEEGLMYAWADLGSDGSAHYLLFVEVEDGYNDGLGGQKSADITPEEFLHYLNAAAPSQLTE